MLQSRLWKLKTLQVLFYVLTFTIIGIGKSNAQTSSANDFDGDGIIDSEDLDDDNDGIIDCSEGYTGGVLLTQPITSEPMELFPNSLTKYTGQIISGDPAAINNIASGADGNFGLATSTNAGFAYQLDTDHPVDLEIVPYTVNVAGVFTTNDRITFSSDVSITLNNPDGHIEVSTDAGVSWSTPTTITANSIYFRPIGGISDIGAANFTFTMQGATRFTYKMESTGGNPNGSTFRILVDDCSDIDTDNDGIPDRLDLDADNDGCPDAIEGGGTFMYSDLSSTTALSGTVNTNSASSSYGVPVSAGTGQTTGSATDSSVVVCCDPVASGYNDIDGDGISDLCDQDDDNDGILNCTEGYSGVVYLIDPLTTVPLDLFPNSLTKYTGQIISGDPAAINNVASDADGNFGLATSTNEGFAYQLDTDHPVDLEIVPYTVNVAGVFTTNDRITFSSDVPITLNNSARHLEVSTDGGSTWSSPVTFVATSIFFRSISGISDLGLANFTFTMQGATRFTYKMESTGGNPNGATFRILVDDCSDIDTDNDGIPDRLDLDADNDGCFDSLEASTDLTESDLNPDGSINDPVSTTGIPGVAGGGYPVGTSTDGNTLGSSCSVLSIQLSYFNAVQVKSDVELSWETISESDSDYFIIEYSVDGINFTELQNVESTGNSDQAITYNSIHTGAMNLRSQTIYYRLYEVSDSGVKVLIATDAVHITFENDSLHIFPNPVRSVNYFTLTGKEIHQYRIVDMQGRVIEKRILSQAQDVVSISTSQLKPGLYILVCDDNRTIKFVVN